MSCESEQLLLNAVMRLMYGDDFTHACMYVCMHVCVYMCEHICKNKRAESVCTYLVVTFFLIQDGQGVFCRQLRRRLCVHDIRTTAPEQSGGIVSHERSRCDACFVYACACIRARTHAHARM